MSKLPEVTSSNRLAAAITGTVPGTRSYETVSLEDLMSRRRYTNIMLFGEQGTGKTYAVVGLLLSGLKVLIVNTDFARSGIDTITNWFIDHPECKHLQKNLCIVNLGVDGVLDFVRNPQTVFPQIYEWEPDVLFWDGGTAFQSDFEEYVADMDPMNRNPTEQRQEGLALEQSDWGAVKVGTLRRLHGFLNLHNAVTNKKWSKVVTLLQDEKLDYAVDDKGNSKPVPGTGKTGPMLHGAARKIAGAGFSIILQTVKRTLNDKDTFTFVNRGSDLLTKDRGFGLPKTLEGDFEKVWKAYIEPRIAAVEGEK